ncbi:PfkB family carbohydrate kinase [Granulicoccus sp. GXG6511]|uniref:PfkB family carbohydrate kinase n=1 Tax=Granulicoccus sp. GXG6511 TaxID=3381351 RepID=UPI003D7DCB0E
MEFVVCGEALIDLVPEESVDTFRSTWGALSAGGPMNTAVGLARLGEAVQFAGRLSDDQFGRQLRAHLRANGVGLDRAVWTSDPTSLAVVSLDEDQKATYAFHFEGTANFGWRREELAALSHDQWLHIASLSTVVQPGAAVLLDWAGQHAGPVSLDINVRPSVLPEPTAYWAAVEPWLDLVGGCRGIVKASDDDIDFLATASGAEGSARQVMSRWCERFGFSAGVVTLGPEGAFAVDERGAETTVPGRAVKVVDTVGAGDTFMAAFLAEFVQTGRLETALIHGVSAGAYVCGRQGPQPPNRTELAAFING